MSTASPTSAPNPHCDRSLTNQLSYLRSLLFTNLLIYFYTFVCGTASLVGSIFDGSGRWQHGCSRVWSWLILKTSGIRVSVSGLEHVHSNETQIFCANHQSAMDIPILLGHLPVQFRFVAKRSLFHLPFLGWHLRRSGHIPVDRGRPREALRSLEQAAQQIRQGRSVVLFPEGQRSRDGRLGDFKSGSFYLAIRAGVPVVPITLNRTRNVLQPFTLHVRSGQTELIVHPPIPTAGLTSNDVERLARLVREQIQSKLQGPRSQEQDSAQGPG